MIKAYLHLFLYHAGYSTTHAINTDLSHIDCNLSDVNLEYIAEDTYPPYESNAFDQLPSDALQIIIGLDMT